jgi:hypothetical protein
VFGIADVSRAGEAVGMGGRVLKRSLRGVAGATKTTVGLVGTSVLAVMC